MIRVLHIVTWFPNKENPKAALWIQRHIKSLENYCQNTIWHVECRESKKFAQQKYTDKNASHWIINLPTSKWLFIELVTFFQLIWTSIVNRRIVRSVDIINFHIAYPSLTFWKYLRPFLNKKIIITEHWSAYHFGFGVQNRLPRIQNIFAHKTPLIAVSNALVKDILTYSRYNFPTFVVPNVVETKVFNFKENLGVENEVFFMLSQWKSPKKPLVVLQKFIEYLDLYPKVKLNIAGYGPLEDQILRFIETNNLESSVVYLGKLETQEIAAQFHKSTAFIHVSSYETFSVVCAEALCCGCPVIASNVGGIAEFVSENNGKLINSETEIFADIDRIRSLNRKIISDEAQAKFSEEEVGEKYFQILKSL